MSITIRAYNVLFGDCLLISWDEDDGKHHAWVDFGNFHNDRNEVFQLAYDDVLKRIQKPAGSKRVLDLVVITHRHLDHLEGFHSLRASFKRDFVVKKLWYAHVTPSLDSQFKIAEQQLLRMVPQAARQGLGQIGRIYTNNFGLAGVSTQQRMDQILETFPCAKQDQHAVHRESALSSILPSGVRRLGIEILAPEKNSSPYLQPLQEAVRARQALGAWFLRTGRKGGRLAGDVGSAPAGGLPAEKSPLMKLADFARLHRKLQTGGLELLRAVDKTRNNTSVVLALTYDGHRRILLTGDAEEKSWEVMQTHGVDLGSDLVKVGHHGSVNASPHGVFTQVLTRKRTTNAVIISSDPGRYPSSKYENEVPKEEVVHDWRMRLSKSKRSSRLKKTYAVALGKPVSITYR